MTISPPARLALQLCVALAGLVPIAGGMLGVLHPITGASAWAVNHDRYLSGLLLAIGVAFWTTIPAIEARTGRFRLLTGLVAIGGLGRLVGVLSGDPLSLPVGAALGMELAVTPLLCFWQSRLGEYS